MSGVLNLLLAGAASAIKDAYFNLTTLLLNTSSTNGAQNNTFLDSSTNNFTITRNGNTTQGTFTPFSQTGWSYYNNGTSGNNITAPSSADFGFSGEFTIEAWVNKTANSSGGYDILASVGDGNATNGWFFELSTSRVPRFYSPAVGELAAPDTSNINDGNWHHWAIVRNSSNVITMYRDGINISSITSSGTINYTGSALAIGTVGSNTSGGVWNGYISNFRIVKGTAVYTSNFTPSTQPLTAITGTSILACQSNRFVDNSASNRTITVNGTPSVQAFSPFAPTAAYITSVVGGSGYFDGSGDYLTVPDTALLEPGTGDFTFETWVYHTVTNNQHTYTDQTGGGLAVYRQLNTNKVQVDADGNVAILTSTNTVPLNAWTHIAVARSGTTLRIFINGALDSSVTNSTNIAGTSAIGYGASPTGVNPMQGYMSSTRFTKGAALYTAAFTPATAPFTTTVSSGTVNSLLNFTNAGIFDSTAKNVLETVGNAQVSTTQAKWGTTSMYFDGTGDALLIPTAQLLTIGTGDFTIEGWINPSSQVNAYGTIFGASASNGVVLSLRGSGTASSISMNPYGSADTFNYSYTFTTSTWYHVAVTRSGTSLRIFINGTQLSSTVTNSTNWGAICVIGGIGSGTSQNYTGYMDDARITLGYARYTGNFSVPTAAFPLQ